MGEARKIAAASDGILDQIAESLVANDHEFRMARKVERLISSAAPGLWSTPCPSQHGRLSFDDGEVLDVEPIDRQGRPPTENTSCLCLRDHPEVFDLNPKTEFPILRTVPWDGLGMTGYVHFAHYGTTRMARMAGYSYDEIETERELAAACDDATSKR